jgi:Polyglycine hydrolase-like, structural repeat
MVLKDKLFTAMSKVTADPSVELDISAHHKKLSKWDRDHHATPPPWAGHSHNRRICIGLTNLLLFVFALALLALQIPKAAAQTDCTWEGTAPFCDGECSGDKSEMTRLDTPPGGGGPPYYYGPPFGKACATGSKALCCKLGSVSCRWDGTAPFCDGECRPGETEGHPPAGGTAGEACATGSKVYCCHSTDKLGSGGSALQSNPKFTRYAAFWEKGKGPAWQARHGLTSAKYQQAFDTLTKEGYRLVDISGYSVDNKETYAAIWEKQQGPAWVARHGLSAAQYQQEFDKFVGQGYRLVDITGYYVGGKDLYAAIWEKRQRPAWVARHGMTSSQYQQEFNSLTQQGYRLALIRGWRSGDTAHYAAIWEKKQGPAWVARHGMLSDVYQEEFDKLLKEGYRLRDVSGYHTY